MAATETRSLDLKIYEGPSLAAPFAAIVAEFDSPYAADYPTEVFRERIGAVFRVPGSSPLSLPAPQVDFAAAVASFAVAFQEMGRPLGLQSLAARGMNGRCRIAVEFFNAAKGADAVRAALSVADALFAHLQGMPLDAARLEPVLRQAGRLAHGTYIGVVSFSLLKAARGLKIPVYEPCPGSNVLVYGQGTKAIHHSEAICSRDSATGYRFAQDKFVSNQLVKRLGFPGVTHIMVSSPEAAREAGGRLGPPLVVKPVDRNGSIGVSVGVDTKEELDIAAAEALRLSQSGKALIEKLVPGDEHRLSVFAGKFFRASRLVKAHIFGDGRRSIAELIADDNRRRREIISGSDAFVNELKLDAKMIALIKKQGFAPGDILPHGQEILLAGTSNLKSGGRREEVTEKIHPENAAMAEAIARAFRLDAAGIDFITPDIARPWTDVPCAILEVNANPGTDEVMAAHILPSRFAGSDGRIPSLLIVGNDFAPARRVAERLAASGKRVGLTSAHETDLAGQTRFAQGTPLPERLFGLLIDPSCEILVVQMTVDDLAAYGLPHTRYTLAAAARDDLPADIYKLVADNTAHMIESSDARMAETVVEKLISTLNPP